MKKNIPLPTLTLDGWVNSKEALIEKLFIYFLAGDVYQSNTYKSQVYTLKEIIHSATGRDPIEEKISTYLQQLYEPYFMTVTPKITIEETESRMNYIIDIDFMDEDGKKYNFNRILQMKENNVENFLELLFNYKVTKKG